MGEQADEEEEEEEEEEKAADSLLLTVATCFARGSHSEIWASFLWFFLVFGVWVLPVERWIIGFLGDGFFDVSALYAQLGPILEHAHASVYATFGWFLLLVVFYGPLYLAVACSALFVLGERMTSGYVVFSASWFDSGYMLLPVCGLCGCCFRFQRNAWLSVVHAMRQSRSLQISTFLRGDRPRILRSIHVATADFPQLQLIFKVVDIPVVTQRLADPHGPYCSDSHWGSPVALDRVVDVPLRSLTSLLWRRGRSTWSTLFSTS